MISLSLVGEDFLSNTVSALTRERSLSCVRFAVKALLKLKIHLHIHTGEKLFFCGLCNKGFSQKSHLNSHLFGHTGERPFVCEVCSRGFTRLDYLRDHLRIHSGSKPFTCGKGFRKNSELSVPTRELRRVYFPTNPVPIRTCSPMPPYVCEKCRTSFAFEQRVHAGEKPLTCNALL